MDEQMEQVSEKQLQAGITCKKVILHILEQQKGGLLDPTPFNTAHLLAVSQYTVPTGGTFWMAVFDTPDHVFMTMVFIAQEDTYVPLGPEGLFGHHIVPSLR